MPYIHFTEDQKLRANSVDLVEFLRRQGEKLISSGQDKRLTSDHSITVHGNEWYDHAAERGGHAISFVQNFYGLTYPEAVTRLLNGEQGEVYISEGSANIGYRPSTGNRYAVNRTYSVKGLSPLSSYN